MRLGFLLLALLAIQDEGFVVITSSQTPIDELTTFQLRQIWFGKLDHWAGTRLQAVQIREGTGLRERFDRAILGNPADVANQLLKQKLQGDARSPLTVGDWALAVAYVKRNRGFIAYIPRDRAEEMSSLGLKIISITD